MEATGDEIRRNVLLTDRDVVAANRLVAQRLRRSGAAWGLPVLGGFVVMAIGLARSSTESGMVYAAGAGLASALAACALVWLYHLIFIPVFARQAYRDTASMRQPTDYVLTSDNLSYVQEDCEARMAWHILARWSVNDHCLLIFNTRLTFYVLPRRGFSDGEVARIGDWLTQAGVPRF